MVCNIGHQHWSIAQCKLAPVHHNYTPFPTSHPCIHTHTHTHIEILYKMVDGHTHVRSLEAGLVRGLAGHNASDPLLNVLGQIELCHFSVECFQCSVASAVTVESCSDVRAHQLLLREV